MLLLTATTDKIQLVTGSAGTINFHASWVDNNAGTITPGRSNSAPTTATTTDVVAAPAASTQRNIKTLNIRNAHASNANTLTVLFNDNGTTYELFKCTLAAQEILTYVEGLGWDIYAADGSHKAQSARLLFKVLDADDTGGQNAATAQPWFPTSGAVTVEATTTYFFEGRLFTTRAAGTTSHTTGILFGGTATLTNIDYFGRAKTGDTNALAAENGFWANAATSLVVKAASTSATENTLIDVSGTVRINAAGTFIPQFIYSVAPGGAPTIKRGTFFRMWPLGSNTVVSQGTWA
jgi:hypothetical protein